jgi:hypothetical protein
LYGLSPTILFSISSVIVGDQVIGSGIDIKYLEKHEIDPSAIPVADIPGRNKRHFLPGTVSSGTIALMENTPKRFLAFCTLLRTVLKLRSSKTVAAAIGSVFRKKDLSRMRIERLIGGRKTSGSSAEFMASLANCPISCRPGRLRAIK